MSENNPIPKTKPDDHEDVSWALSTAEATWNRGDRPDALKWLRRAAEAASEAEADDRALELAKAAAEVATSLENKGDNKSDGSGSASVPVSTSSAAPPPNMSTALTSPAFVPQRMPKMPSKPPPLPKKAEAQKPKAPAAAAVPKVPKPTPSSRPMGPRAPAKLALAPPSAPSDSQVTRPGGANSTGQLPKAKDSEDDLFRSQPAPPQSDTPMTPRSKRNTQNPTAAPTGGDDDDDMEAWPTQSMSGGELPSFDNIEDRTRIGTPAYREPEPEPPVRAPVAVRGLRASQAVRVVVWRSADGVHVAPHGTTVNAISVDAVLVALDPSADLSAWLANK